MKCPICTPLKVSNVIYFNGLMGDLNKMSVYKVEDNVFAQNDDCFAWLEFGKDDRKCWIIEGYAVRPDKANIDFD